ncbi:putative protein carboxyl methylase [Trachipleistophora hominis]|uniref:Methyltransferase domain-containing protein n=1 Tax=Trachipleistophora hominis TaxID=72359 RepID=L7JYS8_TRAHO|nr:putative protein carboxyl methylase [Trachipleistophora hominis]
MARPELKNSPTQFYTNEEVEKYDRNKRIIYIQRKMAEKCCELINCTSGVILDIGCGTGHSISALKEYESSRNEKSEDALDKNRKLFIVGCDINRNMLLNCNNKGLDAELVQLDIGNSLPFQPASFDGIISVSCIQWLFYASNTDRTEKRLYMFLSSMYAALKREASACLQFYYEGKWQVDLLMKVSRRVGFVGGVVIDGEGKNTKYYLVLSMIVKNTKFEKADEEVLNRRKQRRCNSNYKIKERRDDNLYNNKRKKNDGRDKKKKKHK